LPWPPTEQYAAFNLDRQSLVAPEHGSMRFLFDERVSREYQIGPEFYSKSEWDRGHLVGPHDIAWGPAIEKQPEEAQEAVNYYTNICPQHRKFNEGIWSYLEDWIRTSYRPEADKVSVFTGPVFRADDHVVRGVRIPRTFWRLAVHVTPDGKLSAAAYAIDQYRLKAKNEGDFNLHADVTRENFDPARYQVPVAQIEDWTKLDFGPLREADTARR
jgi:endonuclease G, mitochondrial